jgi:beta-glucosidase
VHLSAGQPHTVRVDWAKSGGQAMIELAWTPPGNAPGVDIEQAVAAARQVDVAVLFLSNKDAEAVDRTSLSLPGYQDRLVEAVAAANPRTVVVLNTGGPVLMPWLDKVAGVLEAWYPGEEDGNAIASVLFGDTDPGGRLPITFPRSLADTPANTPEQYPGVGGVATYSEGLDVGYRHYDARGSQVVQMYVGGADGSGDIGAGQVAPPRRLEGFAKVRLAPGERQRVHITLAPRAFAHWDTDAQSWQVTEGSYTVSAGTSSRDLPLSVRIHRHRGTVP